MYGLVWYANKQNIFSYDMSICNVLMPIWVNLSTLNYLSMRNPFSDHSSR